MTSACSLPGWDFATEVGKVSHQSLQEDEQDDTHIAIHYRPLPTPTHWAHLEGIVLLLPSC